MSLAFLQQVAAWLVEATGLPATVAHPGYVAIPHASADGTVWAFGTAADTWQGERLTVGGDEVLERLDTDVRRDCDRPEVVGAEIARRLQVPPRAQPLTLYAWVGEDELGSGRVGIKAGSVPAGVIPLAAMDFDYVKLARLAPQMQAQATAFGKTIRLARFTFAADAIVVTPEQR